MTYEEACKHPKGGAVAMNEEQLLATLAQMFARVHCMNAKSIYEWAKKNEISSETLRKNGARLIKVDSGLLEDVLSGRTKCLK